mmetsp:Transcript_11316/g.18932  ORF Transcript_11316/g.18932 Transcript_11316/m.18932 type:complete len:146 (-) Transcript_11316:126-563(-)
MPEPPVPGVEEMLLLRSLDRWRQVTGYQYSEAEAQACSDCGKQSLRFMMIGNCTAAALAALGSRFGFGLQISGMTSLSLMTGSAMMGGLSAWCLANVNCFRAVIALPDGSPLAEQLQRVAREYGSPALKGRYFLTDSFEPDRPKL